VLLVWPLNEFKPLSLTNVGCNTSEPPHLGDVTLPTEYVQVIPPSVLVSIAIPDSVYVGLIVKYVQNVKGSI
jgi:hypothetical protein